MRVRADRNKCIGSGNCVRLLPGLFEQDDDAVVVILDGNELDESLLGAVREVVESCPTNALVLE